MSEAEVARQANELLDAKGVGDRIILIHSQPEAVYPNRPGPAIIQYPNPVTYSPEFSRNLGYGAQMIRESTRARAQRLMLGAATIEDLLAEDPSKVHRGRTGRLRAFWRLRRLASQAKRERRAQGTLARPRV